MSSPLGALDRRIVAALQLHPRAPWPTIARLADTTETTAARRAGRLIERGVLRLTGLADPIRCGFGQPVLLQLKCEPGRPAQVAADMARRDDVRFCALTTGGFDVVAELISPSSEDLAHVLVEEIGTLPGIAASSTSLVTRNYKTSHDWSRDLLAHARPNTDVGDGAGAHAATMNAGVPPNGEGAHDVTASKPVDLDGTDLRLLAALADNCRRPYAEIVAEVEVSETAVRRRVERLLSERCLICSAYVDPAAIGYDLEFMAWLRVPFQHLDQAAAQLAARREVRYLSATAGSAELVCEVVLPQMADLYTFTTEVLGRLPGPSSADLGIEIGVPKRAWQEPPHAPRGQPAIPSAPTTRGTRPCN
jgi:DNA-binding Lrp family transcriptional regulator